MPANTRKYYAVYNPYGYLTVVNGWRGEIYWFQSKEDRLWFITEYAYGINHASCNQLTGVITYEEIREYFGTDFQCLDNGRVAPKRADRFKYDASLDARPEKRM